MYEKMAKVVEKQKVTIQKEVRIPENLHIMVKDLETLNQYESFTQFNIRHIAKLNKWIKKRKYQCLEHVTDDKLTLKVKIFNFFLT